jgi:hypothetical protein
MDSWSAAAQNFRLKEVHLWVVAFRMFKDWVLSGYKGRAIVV